MTLRISGPRAVAALMGGLGDGAAVPWEQLWNVLPVEKDLLVYPNRAVLKSVQHLPCSWVRNAQGLALLLWTGAPCWAVAF